MLKCDLHKFVLGLQKETLAQVFSCEFCEIFKNTFLQNTSASCFCP